MEAVVEPPITSEDGTSIPLTSKLLSRKEVDASVAASGERLEISLTSRIVASVELEVESVTVALDDSSEALSQSGDVLVC
jgi:hypothetical protein